LLNHYSVLFWIIFEWLCFSGEASKPHTVVWDTSPAKTRHWVLESLPDVTASVVPEDFGTDLRLVNLDEKKQLGGV